MIKTPGNELVILDKAIAMWRLSKQTLILDAGLNNITEHEQYQSEWYSSRWGTVNGQPSVLGLIQKWVHLASSRWFTLVNLVEAELRAVSTGGHDFRAAVEHGLGVGGRDHSLFGDANITSS